MSRRISSILRRHLKANRLLFFGLIIMRACSFYRTHNFFYVVAPESLYCERYFRSYLEYKLAFPDAKAERLFKEKERFISEIAVIYAKISRLRKQYRAVIKKLRDLGNRENRNILEFKINKILSNRQFLVLRALNFFSPRSFFFIVPIGERFTDPFFRLLDFFNKNAEMS
jgi:hypothetical protein